MTLFVQESGPKDAPSLVFLHGGGAASWMWQPVIEHLPEFHILAPDLPEHGQSLSSAPFSMPAAAAEVANIIRQQAHGGQAHLIGLSLGAQVGVSCLSTVASLLHSALLSSPLLLPLPGASLGFYSRPVMKLSYWLAIAPLKKCDPWIRLNSRYASGIPDAYFAQTRRDFVALSAESWANIMQANQSFRLPEGLQAVSTRCLALCGQHEYPAMRRSVQLLAHTLPNASAKTVVHSQKWSMAEEHNWALTAPALFAELVRAWVNEQPLPPALQDL